MTDVLSQDEIDQLLNAINTGQSETDDYKAVSDTRKIKIYDFKRPARETVEQFRGIPVANIDDNMGRIAAVHSSIVPMNKVPLLGPAFTVKVPQGDNLMFHKAMDLAQKGDVILVAGKGHCLGMHTTISAGRPLSDPDAMSLS